MEQPTQATKKGKRARDLLKDYYGLEEEGKEGQPAPPPKRKDDIDGPSFDAEKYFSTLLHNKNLADLLKTETQMQQEMKILDSEMKNLVYENYNKFISATEIIKTMKSHVHGMTEEMNRLNTNMEKISSYSDQINKTLASRREKISQLSSVHRLIKKLQFLVELPSRLNEAIKLEAYSQAVKYWMMANGILGRYTHITSFQTIQEDCSKMMEKLRGTLKERMKNPKSTTDQVVEAVNLLFKLNEEPTQLAKEFLNAQKKILEDKMNSIGDEKNYEESIPSLNQVVVIDVVEYAKIFEEIFIKQSKVPDASSILEEWGKDVYGFYTANLRALFEGIVDTKPFIFTLGAVDTDLNSILEHNILEAPTKQTLLSIIDISAREHIEQVFNRLKTRVSEIIQEMGNTAAESSDGFGNLCKLTSQRITKEFEKLLEKLKLLFSDAYLFLQPHRGVFFQRILVKVQHFFLTMSVIATEPIEKDEIAGKSTINPKFVLCTGRTLMHIEAESVDHISGVVNSLKYLLSEQEKQAVEDIIINTADLRNRLKNSADRAIRYYVKLQSDKLSHMLRKGMETPNWLKMKEARSPRSTFETVIIPEIRVTFDEVINVFEDRKEDKVNRQSFQTPRHSKNKPSVSGEPALFQKKIRLGQEIEFNSQSIIIEVIKVSLKAFVELIRATTFGKTGYNQMQVDIYFLRGILIRILQEDNSDIQTLLDQALGASFERSLDTHGLEQSILVGICEPKIAEIFQEK